MLTAKILKIFKGPERISEALNIDFQTWLLSNESKDSIISLSHEDDIKDLDYVHYDIQVF